MSMAVRNLDQPLMGSFLVRPSQVAFCLKLDISAHKALAAAVDVSWKYAWPSITFFVVAVHDSAIGHASEAEELNSS